MLSFQSSPKDVLRNALPLAFVLGAVGLTVAASSLYLAYRAELADDWEWVEGIAESEAATIESVAAFNGEFSQDDHPGGSYGATLSQLTTAYQRASMWGETVQLHLVAPEGDAVVSLLGHRGSETNPGDPVEHSSELNAVFARALIGEAGKAVLQDRPGGGSMVAFRPVHFPEGRVLGLAVTMDVAETRGPFLRLGLLIGSVTLLLILLGSLVTRGMAQPAFRALEETEDRYRKIFEDSGEAMLITSVGGLIHECNEAATRLLGEDRNSLVGASVVSFYQDPAQREELLTQIREEDRIQGMELSLRRRDGSEVTCLANIHRRRGSSGEDDLLESILTDISAQKERERELSASEARYFDMFAHAPDLLLSIEPGTALIRECNEAVVRRLGFPREEVIGRSALEFCAPESMDRVQEFRYLILETGAAEGFELSLLRKDGSVLEVGANGVAVRNDMGELVAHRLALRDLTEERQLTRRLNRVLAATRDGIWEWPNLDREELWWSPGFFELLGYEDRAFQPTIARFNEMIHPDDREAVAGRTQNLRDTGGTFRHEYRIRRSDGRYIWLESRGQVFSKDANGDAHMSGSVGDVTERKEAEAHSRALIETSPDYILLMDSELKVEFINRSSPGGKLEDVLGQSLTSFEEEEDRERVEEILRGVLKTGEAAEYSTTFHAPDGCVYFFESRVGRFVSGNKTGLIVTARDVTKRVEAEGELQGYQERLRALAARLARIREDERTAIARELHDELGQALTSLRMDLGMARSDLPDEMRELRGVIEGLIQTTEQNIDMVRELSSRLRLPILDVMGLAPAIEWQIDEYRPKTSIQFHLDLPEDGPNLPDLSRIALFRIAQESLTNVFRHSGAENVWVTLKESEGRVMLKVEDDGRGIPPEEDAKARSLGLLGMQERALGIGGELAIGSREGGGTTVEVEAPVSYDAPKSSTEFSLDS